MCPANLSSGGSAHQGGGQRDPAPGGGSRDARISARPASHSHRGHGCSWHRAARLLSFSHGLVVLCSVLHEQNAGEWISVQAAHRSEQPGPEAHQEVTFQGCDKGKLVKGNFEIPHQMLVVRETALG